MIVQSLLSTSRPCSKGKPGRSIWPNFNWLFDVSDRQWLRSLVKGSIEPTYFWQVSMDFCKFHFKGGYVGRQVWIVQLLKCTYLSAWLMSFSRYNMCLLVSVVSWLSLLYCQMYTELWGTPYSSRAICCIVGATLSPGSPLPPPPALCSKKQIMQSET